MVDTPSTAAADAVAAATPGVNSAAPAPAPAAEWYKAIPDELVRGHLELKGWHKLDPNAAIVEAVKSHAELQKAMGIPADQIARLPKDANDTETWAALNKQLGVPADKAGYMLSDTGGSPEFTEQFADMALAANLRPDQARQLAKALAEGRNSETQSAQVLKNAKVEAELRQLHADWGSLYDTNDMLAGRMAQQLGIEPADLQGVKEVAGVEKTMKLLLKLAEAGGEAPFHAGQRGGGDPNRITSPEQAKAQIAAWRDDPEWRAKFASGDKATVQQLQDANLLILDARRRAFSGFAQ